MFQHHTSIVHVVASPQYTTNLFGPLAEIAGARLQLLERHQKGDCLCLCNGRAGSYLIDVDHRDIQATNHETL